MKLGIEKRQTKIYYMEHLISKHPSATFLRDSGMIFLNRLIVIYIYIYVKQMLEEEKYVILFKSKIKISSRKNPIFN